MTRHLAIWVGVLLLHATTASSAIGADYSLKMTSRISQHSLFGSSVIDREILVGEVVQDLRQLNEAIILISWFQANNRTLAYDVRSQLVSAGVSPSAIYMEARPGDFNLKDNGLLTVALERYTTRLFTCNYHRQDYSYRSRDKVGCAMNNLRNLSIINKE